MKTTLLIDADVLIYRASAAVQRDTKWDDFLWTLHADEDDAKRVFTEMLQDILDVFPAPVPFMAITSPRNFRKDVLPTYKANRTDTRKPVCHAAMREWVMQEYDHAVVEGMEGDDVMGIMATNGRHKHAIIVTIDKDLKQIPGAHFRYKHFIETGLPLIEKVTVEEADRFHLYQTLVGDQTDGYKGCPGIGDKRADALLEKAPTWETVVAAYEKAGLTEHDALVQARVARILRASDYDKRTKEIRLWHPTETPSPDRWTPSTADSM